MTLSRRSVLGLLAGTAAAALIRFPAEAAIPPPDLRPVRLGPWGFDVSGMDRSVRPGDSFNLYVNGGWLARTEIPPDLPSFGPTVVSGQTVQRQLRAIIEEAAASAAPANEDLARIGALYRSFMDEARLERLDAGPLQAELGPIAAAGSRADLARLMGRSHGRLPATLFGAAVYADPSGKKAYTLNLGQAGLGLPSRNFYLDAALADQKAAYRNYAETLLRLVSWPQPAEAATNVLAFETALAEASWSTTEQRDVVRTYNPMTAAELRHDCPDFAWDAFFDGAGIRRDASVVVQERSAFPKLATVFAAAPLPTLKAWLAVQTIDDAAPCLSKRFVDAHFDFRERRLSGQAEPEPRWRRGVSLVDSLIGESLGRAFVALYFPPATKAAVRAIVENVRGALAARIAALDWMTPATKAHGIDKLRRMSVKVGYPDRWRDYRGLVMRPDDLFGNVLRSAAFDWDRDRNRIGKPIDPDEWAFTPQTAQAYYLPSNNEIVFCAGMLQPPNFDAEADPAINYGAVGAIIGHEITHGFDDQGRKYDASGTLRDWWAPEDARQFEARAAVLAEQFDRIEALPGARINGRLTLGENIGDLGGVLLALDAYKLSLGGGAPPVIDGFTGEQRVMLGWAQKWRRKTRDAEIRRYLGSDTHSPVSVRAEAPLRNVDAWYRAFNVVPGDKLYLPPEQRVRIW